MDDLKYYIQEFTKALELINKELKLPISDIELQTLLAFEFGYSINDHSKILAHKLNKQNIIDIYNSSGFVKLDEFTTFKTFLPEGTPGRLDEEKIKKSGEIWIVHKTDKDPFPSNPHAHNVQTGHKFHIGNGKLFNRHNKPLNKQISKKDLKFIRNRLSKFDLPKFER